MFALPGIPEVQPGDDIGALVLAAMRDLGETWRSGDIALVAQKIVSKAENRFRSLVDIEPTDEARDIAARSGKDPRKVQAVLDESVEIVRAARFGAAGVVIARHRDGWVSANAGIDESNLDQANGSLLLLPADADASAHRIAETVSNATGIRPGVIITDTFGRPWRKGLVNVAIGLDGVPPIIDWVGRADAYGRALAVTQQAFADELAAAAGLLMPKDGHKPVVIARGLTWDSQPDARAKNYVRPLREDLFR